MVRTADRKRRTAFDLLSECSFSWFHYLLILERQREHIPAEGPCCGSLRKSEVKPAVAVSVFSLDASWGKRTVLFNLLCLMKNLLEKDLWSSFSCPLSGLNSCVFLLKSKSWNCFVLPHARFLLFKVFDRPAAACIQSSLQLLHLHLSKPKLHFSAHLNVRTVQAVVLLSSTNEVGPKTLQTWMCFCLAVYFSCFGVVTCTRWPCAHLSTNTD